MYSRALYQYENILKAVIFKFFLL